MPAGKHDPLRTGYAGGRKGAAPPGETAPALNTSGGCWPLLDAQRERILSDPEQQAVTGHVLPHAPSERFPLQKTVPLELIVVWVLAEAEIGRAHV